MVTCSWFGCCQIFFTILSNLGVDLMFPLGVFFGAGVYDQEGWFDCIAAG